MYPYFYYFYYDDYIRGAAPPPMPPFMTPQGGFSPVGGPQLRHLQAFPQLSLLKVVLMLKLLTLAL